MNLAKAHSHLHNVILVLSVSVSVSEQEENSLEGKECSVSRVPDSPVTVRC